MKIEKRITVHSPLTLRSSFQFPLQTERARMEVILGATWLLVFPFGWFMNMGHRIMMVHHMHHGKKIWPAWTNWRELLYHGWITFLGMVYYGSIGVGLFAYGWWISDCALHCWLGFSLWILAVIAIPGYMSHYCRNFDKQEIFNPIKALSRVFQGGTAYWKAWSIALSAMFVSVLSLPLFGPLGFLLASVWFWQVAGFSFATVFTQRFDLAEEVQEW